MIFSFFVSDLVFFRNFIILVNQCRCGVERTDTKRKSFNRIIGGRPLDKVGVKLFQSNIHKKKQNIPCEAQGKYNGIVKGVKSF